MDNENLGSEVTQPKSDDQPPHVDSIAPEQPQIPPEVQGRPVAPVTVADATGDSGDENESDDQPPHVDSIAPASGSGGTVVTIKGSHFGHAPGRVTFNSLEAHIQMWGKNGIVAVVPALPFEAGGHNLKVEMDVVVHTKNGMGRSGKRFMAS